MENDKKIFNDNITIALCGEAGLGINTIETVFVNVLKNSFYNVYSTKEYMSRIRGGSNSTTIRVSKENVRGNKKSLDIFVPFDEKSFFHMSDRISSDTLIICDEKISDKDYKTLNLPFSTITKDIGLSVYQNMVTTGFLLSIFQIKIEAMTDFIKKYFSRKSSDIIEKNILAVIKGFELGAKYTDNIEINIEKNESIKDYYLLDGVSGIGYGALSAGCNFISSYPMSPSTGLLSFLAHNSKEFEIIVEQAEDEISAINMALGAWYAGARAIVSTSGGGFDLMSEGLSLCGIIESPLVVHLAQRPGPATGLPTKTEQGDLELALFAGHGDYPRIILAPAGIEDAFYLSNKAFYFADKFQVPVFILSDQYFVDTYYTVKSLDFSGLNNSSFIIKTDPDFKRYKFNENGISLRGIPGNGDGFVLNDSDEHDEEGRITEDPDVRKKMVDKRLKKMELIKNEIIKNIFDGNLNYKTLIVSWGSTYFSIKEALNIINNPGISHLHFQEIYPLSQDVKNYLSGAKNLILIENNATGQFGRLLKLETGIEIKNKILKYDGYNFFVEELVSEIKKCI